MDRQLISPYELLNVSGFRQHMLTQKFIIKGTTIDTLTPWVTSPDDNLAAKDEVTPTDGEFTYSLPPQSVVTFVNWDANTETPGLTTGPGVDGGTDVPKVATCQLDCPAAVVPDNLTSGGVTDFSDWNVSTGKWGSTRGLYGAIYGYAGPQSNPGHHTQPKREAKCQRP